MMQATAVLSNWRVQRQAYPFSFLYFPRLLSIAQSIPILQSCVLMSPFMCTVCQSLYISNLCAMVGCLSWTLCVDSLVGPTWGCANNKRGRLKDLEGTYMWKTSTPLYHPNTLIHGS